MLTPASTDPNREVELKRKEENPAAFGQSHLEISVAKDWSPAPLVADRLKAEEEEKAAKAAAKAEAERLEAESKAEAERQAAEKAEQEAEAKAAKEAEEAAKTSGKTKGK